MVKIPTEWHTPFVIRVSPIVNGTDGYRIFDRRWHCCEALQHGSTVIGTLFGEQVTLWAGTIELTSGNFIGEWYA